ncbi:hypothetical protein [Sphingobium sp. Sx8-8]|uniref:hypothetical protein n=1 Tax=Sphingobium sp. Sx8-8 TaxID=2933617 RepID=UPI001F5AAC65|nr:hypothetical protein [Sphingobium sp. Sx8-8]
MLRIVVAIISILLAVPITFIAAFAAQGNDQGFEHNIALIVQIEGASLIATSAALIFLPKIQWLHFAIMAIMVLSIVAILMYYRLTG